MGTDPFIAAHHCYSCWDWSLTLHDWLGYDHDHYLQIGFKRFLCNLIDMIWRNLGLSNLSVVWLVDAGYCSSQGVLQGTWSWPQCTFQLTFSLWLQWCTPSSHEVLSTRVYYEQNWHKSHWLPLKHFSFEQFTYRMWLRSAVTFKGMSKFHCWILKTFIICILEIVSAAFWRLKHGNLQMQCHSAEYEVLNK
jgi:hypothetical protein